MKSFTAKEIIKILKKKSFYLDRVSGSHQIFYREYDKRRVTVPFHNKDLPKGTLLSILRQADISNDEL